jgi:hypothetical protein
VPDSGHFEVLPDAAQSPHWVPGPPPSRPVTPTPPAPATATTYAPSFSGAYAPSQITSALINAGVPPTVAPTLTAISGAESRFGASPVSGVNKNGTRDYGVFQVNEKAWPQFGGPAVAKQPLDQQAAIAAHIYNHQGLGAWATYNSGAYKKFLGQNAPAAPTPPATAPPPPAPPPPAPPLTVGGALAALSSPTGPDGKGLSPLDQASKALGGGQDQKPPTPPSPPLELQQMAFQGRQQQLAQQGAALAAALRAQGAQPLTWGTRPFGFNAGLQDAPGMTLNSMGSPDGV